jgi:hypothetical protein
MKLLSYIRYDIPQGLRSLLYWAPVIWRWRAWDWAYTVDVLIHAISAQRRLEITYKRHVGWERQAQDMQICIEALKRLQEDKYGDMLELVDDDSGISLRVKSDAFYGTRKAVYEYEKNRKKMYLDIATTQLRRHLLNWWD